MPRSSIITRYTSAPEKYQAQYGMALRHKSHSSSFLAQLGHVPNGTGTTKIHKLDHRALSVRYLYATDQRQIVVMNTTDGKTRRVRTVDFNSFHRDLDRNHISHVVFKAFNPKPTPTKITHTPPATMHHGQARKFPDTKLWAKAHNKELDNLDQKKVATWLPRITSPDLPNLSHSQWDTGT